MCPFDMQEMSEDFHACWCAAGKHLGKKVDSEMQFWLRSHPNPPFLEHLSFSIGNQLFFVRVEDVQGIVQGPGSLHGLLTIAREARGFPCLLPMEKLVGGDWVAAMSGWSLLHAETRKPIDPFELVTAEKIEMTPWEVHDMVVRVVREYLVGQGYQLITSQGYLDVDPSIWFVGKTGGPEWVVVRSTKYPANKADRPKNWQEIAASCAKTSTTGHFASVALVSTDQPFEAEGEAPFPLWRGHGMYVNFGGLE